jgi:proprotein convertase subtilisin/kexin type 5
LCPQGQYPVTNGLTCQLCNPECTACTTSASTCQGCQVVSQVSYYLTASASTCTTTCASGTYPDNTNLLCTACNSGCATCFGPSLTECYSCTSNYFLISSSTNCSLACPLGQYQVTSTLTCVVCAVGCADCSVSATNCASCKIASGVPYYLSGSNCLQTCPAGTYADNSTLSCLPCANGCATCFGPAISECSSCTAYNSQNYYLIASTATCSLTCPNEQFP